LRSGTTQMTPTYSVGDDLSFGPSCSAWDRPPKYGLATERPVTREESRATVRRLYDGVIATGLGEERRHGGGRLHPELGLDA
jgi:hypothetical protein